MNLDKKQLSNIGGVILAAGASRRMGQPKQLLPIGNETLLERTVAAFQEVLSGSPIVVVLGANSVSIRLILEQYSFLQITDNPDWEKGMGTSLVVGMKSLLKQSPELEQVMVSVCDQPHLTATVLKQLITTQQETRAGIVASRYNDVNGVPSIFSKIHFEELLALRADWGARKIIKKYEQEVVNVPFAKGAIDLDTPENYQDFLMASE